MAKEQGSLHFDHREIAVIFTLFVFVSLLMFTVGILVGKGLAQAKYEAVLLRDHDRGRDNPTTGASGRMGEELDPSFEAPVAPPVEAAKPPSTERLPAEKPAAKEDAPEASNAAAAKSGDEPLKLIPQKVKPPDLFGNSLQEPDTAKTEETSHILKNPKLRGVFEDGAEGGSKMRGTASVPKPSADGGERKLPPSFSQGKFTVQVGSYSSEKDAADRVESLKKMGFPHSYFTAKELGEKKEIWYRVWLGYFSDSQSAQTSGQLLQRRGEVKNYLVRKTDSAEQ